MVDDPQMMPLEPRNTMQSYVYTELLADPPQVRLLRITRVSGDEIGCSLSTHLLSQVEGQFFALLYVSGEEDMTSEIICEGGLLSLTPSLKSILRDLHHAKDNLTLLKRKYEKGDFYTNKSISYFWIDALCLDQSNCLEISTHIPLMGRIYPEAFATLAYLGPHNDQHIFTMGDARVAVQILRLVKS